MVRPTFLGIEIGRTGVNVSQKGLDVTGHNVANVDTAGYTRQRLELTAIDPYNTIPKWKPVENGVYGFGAKIVVVSQIRSAFYDRQYRTEENYLAQWSTRNERLGFIEGVYEGEQISGVKSSMDEFFAALNTMAENPTSGSMRTHVRTTATTVTETLKDFYTKNVELFRDENTEIETIAKEINTILESITFLNKSIYFFEMDGQPANDLRDKRNLEVDRLSELVDITYSGDAIGDRFMVLIGDYAVVNHTECDQLKVDKLVLGTDTPPAAYANFPTYLETLLPGENFTILSWRKDANRIVNIDPANTTNGIKSGILYATMEMRESNSPTRPGVPYFLEKLNEFARGFAKAVNDIHKTGFTYPFGTATSLDDFNFFTCLNPVGGVDVLTSAAFDALAGNSYDHINASNLTVSLDILNSEWMIAGSSKMILLDGMALPEELFPGNGEIMQQLFNLKIRKDVPIIGNPYGYFDRLEIDIADARAYSKDMTDSQTRLVLSVEQLRLSVAGVSLDEEMTNLIRFQHAYSGAARVITTMDEALDRIINRTGLVGIV